MNIVTYTLLCIFILINPVLASESPQSFAQKDSLQMNEYLYKNRINYALLYFVQPGCVYCQKQSGWYVKTIDIIQNPEVRSKFNINATPVIVLIKRNGSASNWQTVSIGYSPLLTLSADVFRLVRLMNGQAATGQYQIRTQKNAATQITQ